MLWCHETNRIIADRMWDHSDKEWLRKQLDEKLSTHFAQSYASLFEAFEGQMPPFVSFMREAADPAVPAYEPVRNMVALKVSVSLGRTGGVGRRPGNRTGGCGGVRLPDGGLAGRPEV
jgi:hypothetical protein